MRYLIDTHTFLWFVEASPLLPAWVRQSLEDPNNEIVLSVVSLWEISIKVSIGKLPISVPLERLLIELLPTMAIMVLNIKPGHLVRVGNLPFHHRDPFDRMIIAQSLVEKLPILSADTQFDAYGLHRMW